MTLIFRGRGKVTQYFYELPRYNIRYGRPEATDAEVEAAAASAGLHEKILAFARGYDIGLRPRVT